MRKIRAAAAVAAMVVGLGAFGATSAVAMGDPSNGPASLVEFGQENDADCEQAVEQTSASLVGDINLGLGLGILGQGEGEASSDRSVGLECEIGQENEID